MQRNKQLSLSTTLALMALVGVFFAAVRYFGLAVVFYGWSISGAIAGILLGHRSQTSSIIGATIGGAIGAGLGGVALLVIDPMHRKFLGPVLGVGTYALVGLIGGLFLGVLFRLTYALLKWSKGSTNRDQLCYQSLAIVVITVVTILACLHAWEHSKN